MSASNHDAFTDPHRQANALARVAVALAEAGDHQHAADLATRVAGIAHSITGLARQADALTGVATALARIGDHQHAEDIVRSISDPGRRPDAVARVAEALAQGGDHQHATEIARSIADPYQRANALAQIATVLAMIGETRPALRVAAETCAAGQWTTAVEPVLLIMPSAFTELARMLTEEHATEIALSQVVLTNFEFGIPQLANHLALTRHNRVAAHNLPFCVLLTITLPDSMNVPNGGSASVIACASCN